MDAKRHHYVPKFLLRRFSCEPTAEDPLIWRLDKESGRTAWASIKNETVIGHYYRLEAPKKLSPTAVEKYFSDVEGAAATAIRELVACGRFQATNLANWRCSCGSSTLDHRSCERGWRTPERSLPRRNSYPS